ncbi:hypothetical protein BLOT_011289 [Blomia tropicalis]|nr:hypothetical protein BLOT_011289 [Blomia tropicalis]
MINDQSNTYTDIMGKCHVHDNVMQYPTVHSYPFLVYPTNDGLRLPRLPLIVHKESNMSQAYNKIYLFLFLSVDGGHLRHVTSILTLFETVY